MEEVRIIYHINEEETPYLIKLNVPPDKLTLGDFKHALNKPNLKYFVKSKDDDFGFVKEEIVLDDAKLPSYNGKIVIWLVSTEQEDQFNEDDTKSANIESHQISHSSNANNRGQQLLQPHQVDNEENGETESDRIAPLRSFKNVKGSKGHYNRHFTTYDSASSMFSSDLETTSFFDSEDDSRMSSVTGTTMSTLYGNNNHHRKHRKNRKLRQMSRTSSFSSITDSTMSLNIITVTLSMETVSFLGISIVGQSNRSTGGGSGSDGGIYVGSIMKGGAVAIDGRIEPGDMLLEVNGISFEDMSNEEAVRVLREQVQRPGPITLVVAKCWDTFSKHILNPVIDSVSQIGMAESTVCGESMVDAPRSTPGNCYFTVPRKEPVRPIDPRAWVLHTSAMLNQQKNMEEQASQQQQQHPDMMIGPPPSVMTGSSMLMGASAAMLMAANRNNNFRAGSTNRLVGRLKDNHSQKDCTSVISSLPDKYMINGAGGDKFVGPLTIHSDAGLIVQAMCMQDSGLEIRDRVWLKITIAKAFIGSDLVDWLYRQVDGFSDRKEAKKFASSLLKFGYIRHTVNKAKFSEQCYYVLGEWSTTHLSRSSLEEVDSVSVIGNRIPVQPMFQQPPQPGQQHWNHPGSMINQVGQPGGLMVGTGGGPPSAFSSGQYSSVKSPNYMPEPEPELLMAQAVNVMDQVPGMLPQNSVVVDRQGNKSSGTSSSSSSSVEHQHNKQQQQQFNTSMAPPYLMQQQQQPPPQTQVVNPQFAMHNQMIKTSVASSSSTSGSDANARRTFLGLTASEMEVKQVATKLAPPQPPPRVALGQYSTNY